MPPGVGHGSIIDLYLTTGDGKDAVTVPTGREGHRAVGGSPASGGLSGAGSNGFQVAVLLPAEQADTLVRTLPTATRRGVPGQRAGQVTGGSLADRGRGGHRWENDLVAELGKPARRAAARGAAMRRHRGRGRGGRHRSDLRRRSWPPTCDGWTRSGAAAALGRVAVVAVHPAADHRATVRLEPHRDVDAGGRRRRGGRDDRRGGRGHRRTRRPRPLAGAAADPGWFGDTRTPCRTRTIEPPTPTGVAVRSQVAYGAG